MESVLALVDRAQQLTRKQESADELPKLSGSPILPTEKLESAEAAGRTGGGPHLERAPTVSGSSNQDLEQLCRGGQAAVDVAVFDLAGKEGYKTFVVEGVAQSDVLVARSECVRDVGQVAYVIRMKRELHQRQLVLDGFTV